MKYTEYSKQMLLDERAKLQAQYDEYKAKKLKLDMSRGKPGADQLNVSNELFNSLSTEEWEKDFPSLGFDYRNYGLLVGIPECQKLFADILKVEQDNVIVCGNSSLNLMFDYLTQCMISGSNGKPWSQQGEIKFLCPCPGYDRHFAIAQYYGMKLIPIKLTGHGPDMDEVEELIKDSSVKGMFCVPKYSNPTGETYSAQVVERIAAMKPAADDFRIIWDNAYIIHDLKNTSDELVNIFDILPKYGNEDMVVEFTSTSKISFPGAGVSAIAASKNNIDIIKKRMTVQTIGFDKLNQYRHVKYFKDADGVLNHMEKHKAILAPKFEAVSNEFEQSLGEAGIASWTNPNGGYFISLDVFPGTAKRVGELCKNAGVTLTTIGAPFPYGIDPEDKEIRIAPSYPPVDELITAAKLLCVCVKLAAVEKLVG